jgi:hypothetical protein
MGSTDAVDLILSPKRGGRLVLSTIVSRNQRYHASRPAVEDTPSSYWKNAALTDKRLVRRHRHRVRQSSLGAAGYVLVRQAPARAKTHTGVAINGAKPTIKGFGR